MAPLYQWTPQNLGLYCEIWSFWGPRWAWYVKTGSPPIQSTFIIFFVLPWPWNEAKALIFSQTHIERKRSKYQSSNDLANLFDEEPPIPNSIHPSWIPSQPLHPNFRSPWSPHQKISGVKSLVAECSEATAVKHCPSSVIETVVRSFEEGLG